MTEVLSPATVHWARTAVRASDASAEGATVPAGDLVWWIEALSGGTSVIYLKDRGAPEELIVRGRREYVERYFVWTMSDRVPHRFDRSEHLQAPTWAVAPGGPLSVRTAGDRRAEVLAGGEVVLEAPGCGAATEFTHYGYLPVELLIEEIGRPPQGAAFYLRPTRHGHDKRWIRKNRDAPERIRNWAVEQLARRAATTRSGEEGDR